MSINLVLAPIFFKKVVQNFSFGLPRNLLKFHFETGIKDVTLFICGLGLEFIDFFTQEEYLALKKVIVSYALAEKDMNVQ